MELSDGDSSLLEIRSTTKIKNEKQTPASGNIGSEGHTCFAESLLASIPETFLFASIE